MSVRESTRTINICTLNLNNRGRVMPNLTDRLSPHAIDVLCTQEDNFPDCLRAQYAYHCRSGSTSCECVAIYAQTPLSDVRIVHDRQCDTTRYAIIATVQQTVIANCHLCGGRYDDKKINQHRDNAVTKKSKSKKTRNRNIEQKLSLLRKILRCKPDVIVGDFNADSTLVASFKDYSEQYHSGKYFKMLEKSTGLSWDTWKQWNAAPFHLLRKRGYERVPMNAPTVPFGSTVDHVFYRRPRFTVDAFQKVHMFEIQDVRAFTLKNDVTDHHAVYAQLRATTPVEGDGSTLDAEPKQTPGKGKNAKKKKKMKNEKTRKGSESKRKKENTRTGSGSKRKKERSRTD